MVEIIDQMKDVSFSIPVKDRKLLQSFMLYWKMESYKFWATPSF